MRSALLVLVTLGGLLTVVLLWRRVHERSAALLALGAVLVVSLSQQLLWGTIAEDAFITFRYSENLARGAGAVFNEGERVEGYSNFLWMLLIAIPRKVADIGVIGTARTLGVLCVLGTIGAVYALATGLTDNRRTGLVAAILTATAGTAVAYGPSGLETPGYLLVTTLALLAVVRGRFVWAGALLALAVMTRPDGLLVIAVVAAWIVFHHRQEVRRSIPDLLRLGVALVTLLGPWTIWRVAYYGHVVPNAIAAKSGVRFTWQLETGRNYLNNFLGSVVVLLVLAFVGTALLLTRRAPLTEHVSDPLVLVGGMTVAYLGFVVAVGGDWMPAWRFYAPVVPLIAVWIAVTWTVAAVETPIAIGSTVTAATFAFAAVLLVATSATNPTMIPAVRSWAKQVDELGTIGDWFHDTLPKGTEIATFANGSLSYNAGTDITVIDMLGLTDEHIARDGLRHDRSMPGHAGYDDEYIVRRGPSIVITLGGGYGSGPTCYIGPPYTGVYDPVTVKLADDDRWVSFLVKHDQKDQVLGWLASDTRFGGNECP